jgi:hypothetical protein
VTKAQLEATWPRSLRLDGSVRDPNALHIVMLELVYRRASEFDLIHFHLDYYPFSLFSRQSTPFVTTLHGRLDLPEHQPVFDAFSSVPVVSISITVCRRTCCDPNRSSRPISPFSAASRLRRGSIALFALLNIAACRSRSPPRSTTLTANISRSRSGR